MKKKLLALFTALTMVCAGAVSLPQGEKVEAATQYVNYAEALQKSLYFYDANMCGTGVGENSGFAWRDDCHTSDANRTVTIDGKTYNVDVSGGYHDAGDHVKFGLPEGYSLFTLGMEYYYLKDAFDQTGTAAHLQRITDYGAEYFKNCTVYDGTEVKGFVYTVGNGDLDHSYWGSPEAQDAAQGARDIFTATASNPGTDCVSIAAAALAINYINFGNEEDLQVAKDLFAFADANSKATATLGNNEGVEGSYYTSSGWIDDYSLAATLLNIATGDESYKAKADSVIDPLLNADVAGKDGNAYYYPEFPYNWDGVFHAVHMFRDDLQYEKVMPWGPNPEPFDFATTLDNVIEKNGTTTKGFSFTLQWGSARYNAGLQLMGLLYDQQTGSDNYGTWAQGQMDYIFGNNEFGKCLMVGYNDISSSHPHHRASSSPAYGNSVENETKGGGQLDQSHVLIGALCGGPVDTAGTYKDTATDYVANEVTIDYNAAFVGALAALYLKYGQDDTPIDESTLPEVRIIGSGGGTGGGGGTGEDDTTAPVVTPNEINVFLSQDVPVLTADEDVTWTIADTSIVAETSSTATSLTLDSLAMGKTTVTATDKAGNATTVNIFIMTDMPLEPGDTEPPVITPSSISLQVGQSTNLIANEKVTWQIGDESIIQLVPSVVEPLWLVIQAVSAGNTTITATDEVGNKTTVNVTVSPATTAAPDPKVELYGDLNSDGKAGQLSDVIVLGKFLGNKTDLTDTQKLNANVHSDVGLTSNDLIVLVKLSFGEINIADLPVYQN